MPDYTAIAARVKAGFERAQNTPPVAMTLRRTTTGAYDPDTGAFAAGSSVDYPVVGLIQARSLYQTGSVGQNFFNGTLVQTDDQFIMLAASGLVIDPASGDLLIIGGVTFTIVTMIPVRPGGVDLMYRVLARK